MDTGMCICLFYLVQNSSFQPVVHVQNIQFLHFLNTRTRYHYTVLILSTWQEIYTWYTPILKFNCILLYLVIFKH